MKKTLVVVAGVLAAFAIGFQADAAVINFDDVADGTIVNNYYGITFSTLFNGVDGGNVYARASATNNSAPNVVSIFGTGIPAYNSNFGTIHAAFGAAQTSVSVDVFLMLGVEGFGSSGTGYLKAYDSNGVLVGEATTTTVGSWQTLSISGTDIVNAYFTVASPQYPTYGYFDNFSFGAGAGGGGGNPVPEPGTMMLLGSGLIGLAGYGRRVTK